MGKIRNIVKADMIKIFTSSTFWLAVLAVAIISLTGIVARDISNESYNIFSLITTFSREQIMLEITTDAWNIIFTESGSYLWMFAPVLSGMPLIPLLCAERRNRAMRYELVRVGKNRFVFGKLISAMLSGGMVLMFGYAIFCLVIYILMPIKGNKESSYMFLDMLIEIHPGFAEAFEKFGVLLLLVMKLVLFFVYGAFMALMAYVLSSFITNKYIVLCVPYITNYILSMFADRQMMTQVFYTKSKIYQNIVQGFRLQDFTKIYFFTWDRIQAFIIQQMVFLIIGVAIYSIVIRKRCDCGQ